MVSTAVMQPTGNEVSAEAFRGNRRSGRLCASQQQVLEAFTVGPMTRNDAADRTGLPLASICGRCRELLDADLIKVTGTTQDKPARQLLQLTEKGQVVAYSIYQEGSNNA
ncbi:MarR family winged helix-turn-helix transcriptional regulator [Vreelandella populi]|uniref:MarR family winged helix-turn-helix transcriptional regulator n=1 Tax=Vreelandella populi TaxID=2498858 RepID=UPI000F8C8531|nr:MarR family winged helix-turn-helix transcriptional regulator [Halomonas populi]RUR51507.1 MarR family transcriptional regulator [Halomonas populi]